jgi:hypothetical protein
MGIKGGRRKAFQHWREIRQGRFDQDQLGEFLGYVP